MSFPIPPFHANPFSLSKSHILGFYAVYLRIIYVYLMLTQRVRSGVRRHSSQSSLPVHCCCGWKFDLCHSHSDAKVLWVKKKKGQKNGRALRGEPLYMDSWSSSWPSSLIGCRYISRTPPVHLKKNTASVHTRMHSPWVYGGVYIMTLKWGFQAKI